MAINIGINGFGRIGRLVLRSAINNDDFNFITGLQSFEDINQKSSDRFQFILPYYNFDKQLFNNFENGC